MVLFAFFWIGQAMLINPAIPGPPVYIFGGLVCVYKFPNFYLGLLYTCCTGWLLKL